MSKYFRITVYNPIHNVSAILDSNGFYNELWELSSFFVRNGWKVKSICEEHQFQDINIPRIAQDNAHVVLRACMKGIVEKENSIINVLGRKYVDLR